MDGFQLLRDDIKAVDQKVDKISEAITGLKVQDAKFETKLKTISSIHGAIWGIVAGVCTAFIYSYLA